MVDTLPVVRTFADALEAYADEDTIAVDLETSGLSPWKDSIHVVGLYGPRSGVASILHYPDGVVPGEVIDWLSDRPNLVTHNGTQFDLLFLANVGLDWRRPNLYDTLIGEQATLYTSRRDIRVNLADTVKRHFGKKLDKAIDHSGWANPELDDEQLAYITGDITLLTRLKESQWGSAQNFPDHTPRLLQFEMELTKPVLEMELNGLPVDLPRIASYMELGRGENEDRTRYLYSELGTINLNSPIQLKKALGERFDPRFFPGTAREVLAGNLGDDEERTKVCQALLDLRYYEQRRKMFGDKWNNFVVDHDGVMKVHGKFWQLGTNTGRFSSSDPNLQQIPRDMRNCFGGRPGWALGKSDYAAIEVRVAALVAGDTAMIDAINAGEDIHRLVASVAFRVTQENVTKHQRQVAKALSFTLVFGGGVPTFRRYVAQYGIHLTEVEADAAMNNFLDRFQGIRRLREQAVVTADKRIPFVIMYPTGLRRVLAGDDLRHTTMLNNTVQGLAAAGIKYALIECWKSGVSKYLCAIVHDEFVYSAPFREIDDVRREIDRCMLIGMQRALATTRNSISVGVESAYGSDWTVSAATEIKTESGV